MNKSLLFLLMFASLNGCKCKTEMSYFFPYEYELKGHIISKEISISRPQMAYVADSLIVVTDMRDEENFGSIYNTRKNMEHLASFGTIGLEIEDFTYPIMTSSFENKIVILDKKKLFVCIMEITNNLGTIEVLEKDRHTLPTIKGRESFISAKNIIRMNDICYVGLSGRNKAAYYSMYDNKMNFIDFFGDAPFKRVQSKNLLITSTLDPSSFKSGGGLFIIAPYLERSVTCYKMDNDSIKKSWEDHYAPTHYKVDETNITYKKNKTIIGCKDAYITNHYIYLWVDYTTMDEVSNPNSHKNQFILVYSHDGKRVAKIQLDNIPVTFVVSNDDKTLYAIISASGDRFAVYDLPIFYRND